MAALRLPPLLLVNGIALAAVGLIQFGLDIAGYAFGFGPTGPALHGNLDTLGYAEAHGLAFILGAVLIACCRDYSPGWHAVAAGAHALLGACNIVFWSQFVRWGLQPMGLIATSAHVVFFVLEMLAILRAKRDLRWNRGRKLTKRDLVDLRWSVILDI